MPLVVEGPRGGGFQLFGPAESGKTAAAMITGSIWGCHRSSERREKGFAESWHTTAGKVELTALSHNNTVLIPDETKLAGSTPKAQGEAVLDMSIKLTEGSERQRMTNAGSVRGWMLYFLSTSNLSLEQLAAQAGVEVDDAQRGRFVDIPNPKSGHGIYEHLHGFADGQKFTDTLRIRSRKYCGSVGQEFASKLVAERHRDSPGLKQFLNDERAAYLEAIKGRADAQNFKPLNRASARFATVFAAGSLAIKYGIFLWGRMRLLEAILSCQLDGLQFAKTESLKSDTSVSDVRRKLVEYLRDRRRKFLNLDDDQPRLGEHKFGSVPGYFTTFKSKKWFYLSADQLRGVVGSGKRVKALLKELAAGGFLDRASNGRYLVQRPIFAGVKGNKGHKWVHAFRARILKASGGC